MVLVSNLLMQLGFCLFASHGEMQEMPQTQASIIQRVEPGLAAAYDQAKITIKE